MISDDISEGFRLIFFTSPQDVSPQGWLIVMGESFMTLLSVLFMITGNCRLLHFASFRFHCESFITFVDNPEKEMHDDFLSKNV